MTVTFAWGGGRPAVALVAYMKCRRRPATASALRRPRCSGSIIVSGQTAPAPGSPAHRSITSGNDAVDRRKPALSDLHFVSSRHTLTAAAFPHATQAEGIALVVTPNIANQPPSWRAFSYGCRLPRVARINACAILDRPTGLVSWIDTTLRICAIAQRARQHRSAYRLASYSLTYNTWSTSHFLWVLAIGCRG